MHICCWSCRPIVDCVLRREGKCVCSRWQGCSLLLRDNVSISFAYLFLSAAFPPVKLQGQFHQTNVVHYEPLWILNNYKLFSGVILALVKRYTVKCSLFFFFSFPPKMFAPACVISPLLRENWLLLLSHGFLLCLEKTEVWEGLVCSAPHCENQESRGGSNSSYSRPLLVVVSLTQAGKKLPTLTIPTF